VSRVVVVDGDARGCERIMARTVRAPAWDELGLELSPSGFSSAISVVVAEQPAPEHLHFGDVQVDADVPVRAKRRLQQEHAINEQHRIVRCAAGGAVRCLVEEVTVRPERDQESGDERGNVEIVVEVATRLDTGEAANTRQILLKQLAEGVD
jgi:hypothetical protein